MNVLLISPKDPKVPTNLKFLMGGENTYTNNLLLYPPDGVKYTYITDAVKHGEVSYTYWQSVLTNLIRFRILPLDPGYHCIRLNKKFDLIHSHAYSLKIDGTIIPPVVLGDSSSNFLFLKDYLHWPLVRIKLQYMIRKTIHKMLHIYDRELHTDESKALVVFSKFAKKAHESLGADSKKITVIQPGIPRIDIPKKRNTKIINILFAGVWFERKGGVVLLKAYDQLKNKYPDSHLTLLGPLPKGTAVNDSQITQHDFVSYEKLIKEYYPNSDIFVLVPPQAEGYGMVITEAMSFGIPAIVSNIYALPELVEDSKTGFVIKPGSVDELVIALEKLIVNLSLREKLGNEAKKMFREKYSTAQTNKKLLQVYKNSIKKWHLSD